MYLLNVIVGCHDAYACFTKTYDLSLFIYETEGGHLDYCF